MSETINVRGPEYFRSREMAERERKRIQIIEKKIEEQLPDAFDKLASGLFKDQKIDIEIKI